MRPRMMLAILLTALWLAPALPAGEIHDAALAGDMAKVKALLEKDPSLLNAKGRNDKAPIHWAAQGGHLELVAFLMAKGAPVDSRNIAGETPLVYAVAGGHLELVKFLLAKGADPNARTANGFKLLNFAVGIGRIEIAELLAAKGADMMEKQRDGRTLLHDAALGGSLKLVKLMLDKGAPVDASTDSGETPLIYSAMTGNKEIAAILIGKGAAVNARNGQNEWPLYWAVKFGHQDVAALLLNAGAKTDGEEKETGRTVLHLAAAKGYGEICSRLLAKGAAVNAADRGGETPLVLAKRHGNEAIAAALAAKGATAGTAPARPEPDAGMGRPLAEGQAVVWYLGQSGWAVLTRSHFLIFDYSKNGPFPDEPSLANGAISPAELKELAATVPVTVFVSHAHEDHYAPAIWEWRKTIPNITYILGFEPQEKETFSLLKPHEKAELNGLEIIPIESNDSGQGFFVKTDGVSLFHPGDHANRQRDFSGPFKKEIDFLADAGLKADILFAPVSGCGFGDLVSVKKGVFYTIDRLSARSLFPMHAGEGESAYAAFAREAKNAGYDLPVCAAEFNGDRFAVTPKDVKGAYSCPQNCGDKKTCAGYTR